MYLNGLDKIKFKKLFKKLVKVHPLTMLAPKPLKQVIMAHPFLQTKPKPIISSVAPEIIPPKYNVYPPEYNVYPPEYNPSMPTGGFYPPSYEPKYTPVQVPPYHPQYPAQRIEPQPSARNIPEDFYPTAFDYTEESNIDNVPILTPYESAAASIYGNEEDFIDTPAAYESEAGYLNGLGQESGSTGGWFSDLIPQLTKSYTEITAAKAAAKRARVPAPYISDSGYRSAAFGAGFNLNTALMLGAIGLGGFLLFQNLTKKRRR